MRLLVFLAMAFGLFSSRTFAEGGCPPGQYPQQGNGWRSCVPIANSMQPGGTNDTFVGPTAVASWASLSADTDKGVLGESADSRTRVEAENTAMAACMAKGGKTCHIIVTAKNGCIAMALSSDIFATASGPTTGTANSAAIANCKKGKDPNCQIMYSKCVQPVYQ